MKIFSRIVTIISLIFLILLTVFNMSQGILVLGTLTAIFAIVVFVLSVRVGIWQKGEW